MSAVAGLSSSGLDAFKTSDLSSSAATKSTGSTDEASSLKDKLKNLSEGELKKLIEMLAQYLMKMMPIGDIGEQKNSGGCSGGSCNAPPPPPAGGCSGGGGGGGCSGGGSAPVQGIDGRGPGTAGTPDASGRKPWDDFSQTSEGNCVSIAVIKAGMDKYGDKMYQSKTPNSSGGFDLVLQNGKNVSISGAELALAQKEARFRGDPNSQGYKDGVLAYAAIAKGKAAATGQSYGAALDSLGNGEYVPNVAHYLGMKVNQVDPSMASHLDSAIKTDVGHALALDDGATDVYGRKVAFGQDGFNRGTVSYFDLA